MSTAAKRRYTVEEYLAFERESESKHEFHDGELFAMAGANKRHNLITGNLFAYLKQQLRNRDCRAYPSDMRVLCPTGLRTYPDTSIVCGPEEFEDDREDTLLNPLVIVEVLSPSTASYDRGRKCVNYPSIPSLREYIVIEQTEALVDQFVRRETAESEEWVVTSATGVDGDLHLRSLDLHLPLSEVYLDVEFPEAESNG